MHLPDFARRQHGTLFVAKLDLHAGAGKADTDAIPLHRGGVIRIRFGRRERGDRVGDFRFAVSDANDRPEYRAGLVIQRWEQRRGATEQGADALYPPALIRGKDFRQHGRRGKQIIDGPAVEQRNHLRQIDAIQQHGGGAAIVKCLGQDAGAMHIGRHQQHPVSGSGHLCEAGALQQIGDPARPVRGDDGLGLAGGAGGEADPPICLGGDIRQTEQIAGFVGKILDREHVAAQFAEIFRLRPRGNDQLRTGQTDGVFALGVAHRRIQRRVAGPGDPQTGGCPDGRYGIAQRGGNRIARLHAAVLQPMGNLRRPAGEFAEGEGVDAVGHGDAIGELVGDGGEVPGPRDRGQTGNCIQVEDRIRHQAAAAPVWRNDKDFMAVSPGCSHVWCVGRWFRTRQGR